MNNFVKLLRVSQWVKNGVVILPLFFGRQLTDASGWLMAWLTFAVFCIASSAIYCLNDIRDKESDALHPDKKHRPVASGAVSVKTALTLTVILIILAVTVAVILLPTAAVIILSGYLALQIAYCLGLKRYAIVDVFCIAAGFVLRLAAGGAACQILLSPWIVSLLFLLSLFMAFAKRRDDVIIYERSGILVRKNIQGYNLAFLNQTLGILAAVTIVCYIMYTVSPDVQARLHSDHVYITSVFVVAAILRYLQQTIVNENSGSPTQLVLHDRFIQACAILWAACFAALLYW